MIPILFGKTESSFTSNGLGRLVDAISCTVTEQRNGQYELEMVYPIDGKLYELIENDMVIGVIPSVDATLQAFDIYSISKPLNGKVTINAHHISYRLSAIVTTGGTVAASNNACAAALASLRTNAILAPNQSFDFTFQTDVTTVAPFKKTTPTSVRSRLGGSEGSILDQFGGEFEWDNFTVKLHHNRGSQTNITIRYGKNLTDLTQDENNNEMITGCVGYWRNEQEMVVGDIQLAANHAEAVREKIVSIDFTTQLGEGTPTKAAINSLAQIYVNKHNLPRVNMKVSFIDLAQTEEYKDYAPLEKLHLCDYVNVIFEKLGVTQTARVIKTVYNVLENRYKSIEIGDNISTLFETLTDSLAAEIDAVSFAALNATAWLTRGNGYVVAVKNNDGSWKELLFMDTNDIATAHNVLRLNTNGLGFSTTGVNGTYANAWTIDGHLVADFIDTGTLNASKVNVTNINASNITVGTLDASKVNVTNINAGNITTGTIDASKINVTNINASNITVGTLDGSKANITNINADNISTGTVSANRIAANSISVEKLTGSVSTGSGANKWEINLTDGTMTLGTISADKLTAGTIDASVITVTNINAAEIKSGYLSANRIEANSIGVGKLTGSITSGSGAGAWEINLNSGTMTIGNISAGKVTTGTMSADRIRGGTLALGGSTTDGSVTVKDGSNNNIFVANKNKIEISGNKFTVSATNFSLTSNGTMTANNATLNTATINTATITNARITNGLFDGGVFDTIEVENLRVIGNLEIDACLREFDSASNPDEFNAWMSTSSDGLTISYTGGEVVLDENNWSKVKPSGFETQYGFTDLGDGGGDGGGGGGYEEPPEIAQ